MKIFTLVFITTLFFVSCNTKNDQVVFTGQIINPTVDMVWITINDSLQLSTKLDENNKFEFKLDIREANRYRFDHGGHTFVFLKPGSVLDLTLDTKHFDESITYSGTNVKENEYLKKRLLLIEGLSDNRFEIPNMSKNGFDSIINNTLGVWKKSLFELKDIESDEYAKFKKNELEELDEINTVIHDFYNSLVKLRPGNKAIDFIVEDIHGREYSLKDFKNKVVCIDVWSSWCSACLKEMPYLEKLENKYKKHDIEFIVVSVDDKEDVWRKLLKERDLHGNQYWSKGGQKSNFFKNYQLKDLPVYIVIDKNGKIVKPRAPRPSENLEDVIIKALNI